MMNMGCTVKNSKCPNSCKYSWPICPDLYRHLFKIKKLEAEGIRDFYLK